MAVQIRLRPLNIFTAATQARPDDSGPPRAHARLAQLVERKALNLVVVGSSPTVGDAYCRTCIHGAAKAELDHICSESSGQAPLA